MVVTKGIRMCAKEEYDVNHGLFGSNEDDGLGGLIDDIFDIPVDCLDGDEFNDDWVDWGQELGPIPSNVFSDMQTGIGNFGGTRCGGGVKMDFLSQSGCLNVGTCEPEVINPQPKPIYSQEQAYRIPKPTEAHSPDSVLEHRMSTSSRKTGLFGTEIAVPVRTRTKRSASGSTTNSWLKLLQQSPFQKVKKIRKKAKAIQHDVNEVKKCSHCEITKTPQWREGPTGPKSLCNACGVRYRSGRLFPEYRPAASPTFVPSLHSNSHRRVVAMRQKGAAMNDDDNYFVKKHLTSNVESQHSRLWS